ncbi:plasminogen activator inhibitor 1 isoform X1 [Python bivittatus]|uniref:RING-type E3 ubiquitin transferase n=1 Tax=Python bivittatus TaxID=176946 RepID=A0A9F5MXT8_PYTBI|nr:plasminogen activator inhibitor 1 isoform X1 [Python bivittatus]XP_025030290.1 plasminogen activator inhibitor 1 isoform X1 [Python bivittatus]XP_025030291.1 plasminogen activator inhibitor 1 isoform X1 [Python bivittatus]
MAAKASSLWETLSSSFLTCTICLEPYCQPKILPCLHTYCQDCLKKLLEGSKQELRCPECRKRVPLPAGVEGLKTNFFINSLLDLVPPVEKARATCSLCPLIGQDAGSAAVSHCLDCADNLCQVCARGHRCSRLTHSHLVVDMEHYCSGKYSEEIRKRQASRCKEHKGEDLRYFCIPCATALCRECRLGPHLQHPCLSLSEAAKARRPVITGLLAGVEETVELISQGKLRLEKETQQMEAWNLNVRSVVQQTCAKAVEQLLTHQEKVLGQLSGYLEEQKKALGLLFSELEFQEQVATTTVAFAQKVLNLGQEGEIISLEQMISERLQQLQSFSWEPLTFQPPSLHIQSDLLSSCNLFRLELDEKAVAAAPERSKEKSTELARNSTKWKLRKQEQIHGAEVEKASGQEKAPDGKSPGLAEAGGPPPSKRPEVPRLVPQPVFFCSFWVKIPTDKERPQVTGLCPFGPSEVLVADKQNRKLKRFSLQGEFRGIIPVPSSVAPFSVAAIGNKVVFTAGSQLYVLNEQGGLMWQKALQGGQASHAVTTCDGDCVVVCVAGSLEVFNLKGHLLEKIVLEGSRERCLVFLARRKGGFVASDWYRRSVVLLTRKGDLVAECREEQLGGHQPGSVCADAPGIVYVVLQELNKVVAFSETGEELGSFVTAENSIYKPRVVTIAGDRHFVVALTNGTIHVFKIKYQGK